MPNKFITIGTKEPSIKSIDCFEKIPEFLIEYFTNINTDKNNNKYVYALCT